MINFDEIKNNIEVIKKQRMSEFVNTLPKPIDFNDVPDAVPFEIKALIERLSLENNGLTLNIFENGFLAGVLAVLESIEKAGK